MKQCPYSKTIKGDNILNRKKGDKDWYKSSFNTANQSFEYHYKKHVVNQGINKTKGQYFNDAVDFFKANKASGFTWKLKNGDNGIKIKGNDGKGGIYSSEGKPTSFWYNFWKK